MGDSGFSDLDKTIRALLDPETGCPWDCEQTHRSLSEFMIEEAHEAAFEMKQEQIDDVSLRDELGDVLFQVLINSEIARREGRFTLSDVAKGLNEKLIRRHPHVFGSAEDRKARTLNEIWAKWHEIKEQERKLRKNPRPDQSLLRESKWRHLSALEAADKIGGRANKMGFDWQDAGLVLKKLREEIDELAVAMAGASEANQAVVDELGDVYFTLSQLCRHLDLRCSEVAARGNQKFFERFVRLERIANTEGDKLPDVTAERWQELWDAAKREEA